MKILLRFIPCWLFLLCLILLGSCQRPVDPGKVRGTWVIRKDSSEMKLVITRDSVHISYKPGHTHFSYQYLWKQDEEIGLMECYQVIPLDSEKRALKIIPSRMYVVKVSDDSLSVLIPRLKTQFDMKREGK